MQALRFFIGPLVSVLTALLTEFLGALGVAPKPWHAAAVHLAVSLLVIVGLVGLSLALGEQVDWAVILPLLGAQASPAP